MHPLISVKEAATILLSHLPAPTVESVGITDALGRCLMSPVVADRPLPPFDRVMMDGIAIRHSVWGVGKRDFPIAGTQAAGAPPVRLIDINSCIEVMTGGVLPDGCDCVIPVEEIELCDSVARISSEYTPEKNQHIHAVGSDTNEGDELLSAGKFLYAPELTIAASCGATELKVAQLPRIIILSTGDELVAPHEAPESYQIRRSHATALRAAITTMHLGTTSEHHVADDPEKLELVLRQALQENDVIVLTGGVSRGKFDYVAPVLEKLLGTARFHGVAQRPGKPLAFWAGSDHPPVFALPGNPVSVMACAARYLFPALSQMLTGRPVTPETLPATGKFNCAPHFTGLIACRREHGHLHLLPPSNSGNFLALAGTHGIAELPGKLTLTDIADHPATFYPWQ